MKTLIQTAPRLALLAACLGLGVSQPAHAQSASRPQPVCIDQVGPFTYLVRVSNPTRQPGELQVVNMSNKKLLYQHNSRGIVFGNLLNVGALADGQYAFLVKVGKQTYNYTLDIHSTYDRVSRLGSVSTTAMAVAD
ncbi:hypothetical protein [Hymenobacter jeollabukensis]|uniref:T9SS type A sorting domain-containing protein n=1 Tax=Hymenobacter jeollabukensis TaxID=2025313 RepID=A0A5R8WHW3_9BACT|nr:hypothetical protein [Hymenobacter jeollabukensis]TLM87887.1 hypothetical protein FDY95_24915 [Hymenobacter jeollabukensis]